MAKPFSNQWGLPVFQASQVRDTPCASPSSIACCDPREPYCCPGAVDGDGAAGNPGGEACGCDIFDARYAALRAEYEATPDSNWVGAPGAQAHVSKPAWNDWGDGGFTWFGHTADLAHRTDAEREAIFRDARLSWAHAGDLVVPGSGDTTYQRTWGAGGPFAHNHCWSADNPELAWTDALGYACKDWKGLDCSKAAASGEYTNEQARDILDYCPFSCGQCGAGLDGNGAGEMPRCFSGEHAGFVGWECGGACLGDPTTMPVKHFAACMHICTAFPA